MEIVITGSTGFIGSYLREALIGSGHYCLAVTRKKNIDGFYHVEDYTQTPVGEVLIHCAEPSLIAETNKLQHEKFTDLVANSNALMKKPFKRVIYLSSGSLYGDASCKPHLVTDPVYDCDKYKKIKLNSELNALSKNGTVIRLANVYGPGMSRSTVVGDAIHQVSLQTEIVMQSLKPVRDFLYVDDLSMLVSSIIQRPLKGIFNAGTGIGHSIHQLVYILQQICGTKLPVIERPEASSQRKSCNILNIVETKQAFHWSPNYDLRRGLFELMQTRSF